MKDQQEDNKPEKYISSHVPPKKNDMRPRETFKSLDWYSPGDQFGWQLRQYSLKLADGTITWLERLDFAALVLQREMVGYLGQSFYKDPEDYLKNTISEILDMDHNRDVYPIDVTPKVDFLTNKEKWDLFEKRYEPSKSFHYNNQYTKMLKSPSERPDK